MSLRIEFDGVDETSLVRHWIVTRVDRLRRLAPQGLTCHVLIVADQRDPARERLLVHVRAATSGREFHLTSPLTECTESAIIVAARRALDGLQREFEVHVDQRRAAAERSARLVGGVVEATPGADGIGWLRTDDRRPVLYRRDSVVGMNPDVIRNGDRVRFIESTDPTGQLCAGTVVLLRRSLPA